MTRRRKKEVEDVGDGWYSKAVGILPRRACEKKGKKIRTTFRHRKHHGGACLLSVGLVAPEWCAQRLAYAKADADGDSHDQKDDEDLGNDLVARAQVGHAGAVVSLRLGLPGLLLPVVLSGPYLATLLVGIQRHAFSEGLVKGAVRVEGLNVGIKGIGSRLVRVWVGCDAGDRGGIGRHGINAHGRGEGLVRHRNLDGDLSGENNAGSRLPLVGSGHDDGGGYEGRAKM